MFWDGPWLSVPPVDGFGFQCVWTRNGAVWWASCILSPGYPSSGADADPIPIGVVPLGPIGSSARLAARH